MTVLVLGAIVGAVIAALWRMLGVAATRSEPGAGRAAAVAGVVAVVTVVAGMPVLLEGGERIGLRGSLLAVIVSVLVAVAVVQGTGLLTGHRPRG